jgi:hypothetical protein
VYEKDDGKSTSKLARDTKNPTVLSSERVSQMAEQYPIIYNIYNGRTKNVRTKSNYVYTRPSYIYAKSNNIYRIQLYIYRQFGNLVPTSCRRR